MKSEIRNDPKHVPSGRRLNGGFTLVELLVVVAIIVVLLALLVPAMDKAIYQAELAACGANLKGIASSVGIYAADSKRYYPYRIQTNGGQHVNRLAYNNGNNDDRPTLQKYMPVNKIMQDPLSGKVDLDTKVANSEVYAAYNLWFWVRFKDEIRLGNKGMFKMGDRWTWTNTDSGQPVEHRFNFLAADRDRFHDGIVSDSHPDSLGLTALLQWQDRQPPPPNIRVFTLAEWNTDANKRIDRGTIEMNFARDDGSVQRFDKVRYNEWVECERMTRVPSLTNTSAYRDAVAAPGYLDQVPAR